MAKHRAVSLPSPARLATVLELRDGVLWWRSRTRGTVAMKACPAGSLRPDGRRIVSMRWRGAMRTMGADRVKFALIHQRWPTGRVEIEDGEPVDKPRRAKSPGRRGGLKAERARDQATLDALDGGALCLARVAEAVGGSRSNVRRRLVRLAAQGLVEPPPRCCPDRGWMLTKAGMELTLVDPPAPPAPVASWVRPLFVTPPCANLAGNGMRLVARYG